MKNLKRILSLMLVLMMVLPMLVACGDHKGNSSGEGGGTITETDTVVPDDVKFSGETFTILCREDNAWGNWLHEIAADEDAPELVNEAVYKRNLEVEERFELEELEELFKVKSIADVELELQNIVADEYLDTYSFIASCVGNAYEAALAFSRYYALQQLKSGYIDILRDISESGAFPWDMREAAEELILAYEYAFDHICDDAVLKDQISIFFHESLEDLDESLREKAFNSIVKLDKTGFFATIKYTGKAVVLVLDVFNIDKIAETYYKLEGLVYIRHVLYAYAESLPDCDYLKQANRDSSVVYMNAIELYQKAVLLENEYAKDAFAAYRDKPGGWADDEIDELIIKIDNNTQIIASLYKQYDDSVKNRYNRYIAK